MSTIGRGDNGGPATQLFPLSAAVASSPGILITGTSAAAQTTAHTADVGAQDIPYVTVSNVGAASVTVFTNFGSTATTGQLQTALAAGQSTVILNGNLAISKAGILGMWGTSTSGIYAYGYVARTYTTTG